MGCKLPDDVPGSASRFDFHWSTPLRRRPHAISLGPLTVRLRAPSPGRGTRRCFANLRRMSTSTARATRQRVPPRPARRRTRHAVWRRARRRRRRLLWIVLLGLGGLVLLAFFAGVAERIVYHGRVMPGVSVEGVHVAGVSEKDAYVRLSALAAKLETAPLRARAGSRALVASPSIAGLQVDEDSTFRAARKAGRSRNPLTQTASTFLRRFRPDRVPVRTTFSTAGAEGILDGWSRATLGGQVEGGLTFDGTTVNSVEPHAGIGILHAPRDGSSWNTCGGATARPWSSRSARSIRTCRVQKCSGPRPRRATCCRATTCSS